MLETKVQELVDMLKQLGLNHDEALVFATLSLLGSSGAGAIARAAGMSRPQAYRALDFLTARGVVHTDLGRPRRHTAVPADQLVSHLRKEIETQNHQLKLLEAKLLTALADGNSTPPVTYRTDVLRTRQVVTTRVDELQRSATRRINIVFTHPGGLPLLQSLGRWENLVRYGARGVQVRMLVRLDDKNEAFAQDHGHEHVQIRMIRTDETMASTCVDGKRGLIILLADPSSYPRSDSTVAFTSDTPNFAAFLDQSFEALWQLAQPVSANR